MFEYFRQLQGKNALRMFRPVDPSDLARQKHEPVPKPALNPEKAVEAHDAAHPKLG